MKNAFKSKAKRCCAREHERLMRLLVACETASETPAGRHTCYRQAARTSGRRSRRCIAAVQA